MYIIPFREVRECLKLDPEHKDCFPHYKKVKKVDKFLTDCQNAVEEKLYDQCIEAALKVTSMYLYFIFVQMFYNLST